ncbi:MAG TPA: hypothetical protein VGQ94_07270 [Terriglobales bacterium]|nr:hypothetical protein [Terriglobales bacterium]
MEKDLSRKRKGLIFELANMHEEGLGRFQKHFGSLFRQEPDVLLRNARRDLRRVWLHSTPVREKQRVVDAWLKAGVARLENDGILAPLAVGRVILDPRSFPMQLVAGILENWRRFRTCGNPQCPAPYFLAKRETQRYCERGECTAYAQQQYALKWWDKEGWKRRAAKAAKSRKRRSRHGTRKKR